MRVRQRCLLVLLVAGIVLVGTMDTSSARSGFSLKSIRGTYRLAYAGLVLPSLTPESGLGIFVADGDGRITGTEVFNNGGHACPDVVIDATYTVSPDGRGTLVADFTSPTPGCSGRFHSSLLIYDGGDVVRSVSSSPSFVTLHEEWRRQPE